MVNSGCIIRNRFLTFEYIYCCCSCLVSSGTASQAGETSGLNGSLVDLMAKHVRAILGQHFWGGSGEEDHTKHRHFTLLELLVTVRSFR